MEDELDIIPAGPPALPTREELMLPEELNDEAVVRAVQYLFLKDEHYTMHDIAAAFGITKPTIYAWVAKWEAEGVMDRARYFWLFPKIQEIYAIRRRVLDSWGEVMARVLRTAISGRSDKTSLEAAMWLKDAFIDPALEASQDSFAEAAWAGKEGDFQPDVITIPGFLKKKLDAASESERKRKSKQAAPEEE